MNLNDISIDCETLGLNVDAAIISIGAVAFDRTTGKQRGTYYVEIDGESAVRGRSVSYSTVAWWAQQGAQAKAVFNASNAKENLSTALMNFATWCRSASGGVPRVWFNGPCEDGAWLKDAYTRNAVGLVVPWHHTNVRDMRGIVELAQELAGFEWSQVPDVGTSHKALDDAIYQANVISHCYGLLRRASKAATPSTSAKAALLASKPAPSDDEDL